MIYEIISPVAVNVNKKKIALNLNVWRTIHYRIKSKAKHEYNKIMLSQLKNLKIKGKISMTFRYIKGSKRKSDKSNVLSIVEKFFCDSLTKFGCIADDNDSIIIEQHYLETKYKKNHPHVIIEIKEIEN